MPPGLHRFYKGFRPPQSKFYAMAFINRGINYDLVKLIQEMYSGLMAKIITDVEGNSFDINRGGGSGKVIQSLHCFSNVHSMKS